MWSTTASPVRTLLQDKKKQAFSVLVLSLVLLLLVRSHVSHADCQTMASWGIEVGHPREGELQSGCAVYDNNKADDNNKNDNDVTDVSAWTIRPRELEQRLSSKTTTISSPKTSIPKILHQSFSSTLVPNAVLPFVKSWHDALSGDGWLLVWWTDDDLNEFMKKRHPTYYELWLGMPHSIMRVDTARYFILQTFGGVYADMDIEYNSGGGRQQRRQQQQQQQQQSETLSLEDELALHAPASDTDKTVVFHECIDNALMASTRNASFWQHVIEAWNSALSSGSMKTRRSVHLVTGIEMLRGVCDAMQTSNVLTTTYGHFDTHHGTNSWRWKTKRDDMVFVLDVVVGVYLSLIVVVCCVFLISSKGRRYLSAHLCGAGGTSKYR